MGKRNRERRAASARRRRAERRSRPAGGRWSAPSSATAFTTGDRFAAAAIALHTGDDTAAEAAIASLAAGPRAAVAAEIAALLEAQLAHLWVRGWQPADVARGVDRELGRLEAEVLRRVMAAEASSYEALGARVAPEWMAQLERIGAVRTGDGRRPGLAEVHADWPAVLRAAVATMSLFLGLPALPRLVDPPPEWRAGVMAAGAGGRGDRVLEKVRALLAKAESTTFDAEAEALTAKAQELIARHRVDRALLESAGQPRGDEPVGRRIGVDDPYADAKAALLAGVADVNGCRAVWAKHLGFTTLFGFAADLDAVEELFTSLLVQVTAALRRAGSKHDRFGRSRTTRFRRSFLVAFGIRIEQRLREAVDATVESAGTDAGTSLVPILAARDDAVTEVAEAAYPELRGFAPAATDREGWFAGTLFADQADLARGPALTRRSA